MEATESAETREREGKPRGPKRDVNQGQEEAEARQGMSRMRRKRTREDVEDREEERKRSRISRAVYISSDEWIGEGLYPEDDEDGQETDTSSSEFVSQVFSSRSSFDGGCDWIQKTVTSKGEQIPFLMKRLQIRCEYCDILFDRKSRSMVHVPCYYVRTGTHRNEDMAFRCEFCPRTLANLTLLKAHLMGHLDVGLFKCIDCGKQFARESQIVQHHRVHSLFRPFSCDLCPKSFAFKICLKKHGLLHSGQAASTSDE